MLAETKRRFPPLRERLISALPLEKHIAWPRFWRNTCRTILGFQRKIITHLESLDDHSDVHRKEHYTGKPDESLRNSDPLAGYCPALLGLVARAPSPTTMAMSFG